MISAAPLLHPPQSSHHIVHTSTSTLVITPADQQPPPPPPYLTLTSPLPHPYLTPTPPPLPCPTMSSRAIQGGGSCHGPVQPPGIPSLAATTTPGSCCSNLLLFPSDGCPQRPFIAGYLPPEGFKTGQCLLSSFLSGSSVRYLNPSRIYCAAPAGRKQAAGPSLAGGSTRSIRTCSPTRWPQGGDDGQEPRTILSRQ